MSGLGIVGAGADDSCGDLRRPGLTHAAAYQMEILVTNVDIEVKVCLVEAMFHMKMSFDDADKWAFMKSVWMPGSIQDEFAKQIKPV